MNYPHPMDDKTGFEATDEEMGLRKPSPMERHFAEGNKAAPPARREKELAAMIMDADLPKRLASENEKLRVDLAIAYGRIEELRDWAKDEQQKREKVEEDRLLERQRTDSLTRAARMVLSNWDEFGPNGGVEEWMEGLRTVVNAASPTGRVS